MQEYEFITVDVFTDRRFGGNQLAVFPDASGLSTQQMQQLAAEFNLSETTFVFPPDNPENTAKVRIFNRTDEMPFAGHPTIGTAFVVGAKESSDTLRLEQKAGLVEVRLDRDLNRSIQRASLDAPQPLSTGMEISVQSVADAIGIPSTGIITSTHLPITASVGVEFVIVEVERQALATAAPDLPAFRRAAAAHPSSGTRFSVLFYSRDGNKVRSRMFAPISGTWEDPATGSANAAMVALVLSRTGQDSLALEVSQGIEMGRPSLIMVEARKTPDGIRSRASGQCVEVLSGTAKV
ncbi:PhzF family phenazine biosynthesis protein [Mesorhizobium qingshengii]|uniref:Trans-2,3-dihydro-3-hydroxyanthranilate isomerase n=1 Tax=Mesorhizobium qingshengii TaxID=1165689 RepID=A0A1G5ZA17_9HYPH|nr:PhzF family phenazine biosynthesis protein [Mesorhizobium qingshengii]SDA91466.1 trans-2,3-dihydro-3-hydroxyanthranilate isomerase [Mesorhizobium qingshengii]